MKAKVNARTCTSHAVYYVGSQCTNNTYYYYVHTTSMSIGYYSNSSPCNMVDRDTGGPELGR